MAVSENDLVVGPLTPAAGVTTISLDFYFEQASWLEVYKEGSETPLVLNTDYTVTGAGSSSGYVTLTTAANGTDAYSIYLAVPLQRSSDMQLRGEFKSAPFNLEMDRIWQRLQHHNTLLRRTLHVNRTAETPSPYAPEPEHVIGFDAAGGTTLYPVNAAVTLNLDPDDVVRRHNVAAVLGDTAMGYTSGASVQVSAGQFVLTTTEGFAYEIAASDATDHHVTTEGGVKLAPVGKVFFEHYGVLGYEIGGTPVDDTAAMKAAFGAPNRAIYGMPGRCYRFDPIAGSEVYEALDFIGCDGICRFYTNVTTSGAVGLELGVPGGAAKQVWETNGIHYYSTGTPSDGNATGGLKINPAAVFKIGSRTRFFGYSGKSLQVIACVHAEFDSPLVNGGGGVGVGISLEKNGSTPCTTVIIRRPYLSGGLNGIRSDGTVLLGLENPIFEYGGSTSSEEGALHCIGTNGYILQPYWEACPRNMVLRDSRMQIIANDFNLNGGTASDIVTYTGVAFGDRGISQLTSNRLGIAKIGPDLIGSQALVVGDGNWTFPLAGGSAQGRDLDLGDIHIDASGTATFGTTTTESVSGNLASSGVWETIFTPLGQTGSGDARLSYKYTIRAGTADLTTGFDSGTIINGAIYSDTGTVPAWLRMDGGNLQMNITSSSYGLSYAASFLSTKSG